MFLPMIRKILYVLTTLLGLFGLAACVNLKPAPSQAESYTLGPVEMQAREKAEAGDESIYILRPQLPTYLDDTRVSYRSVSGEVKNMLGARWAEPLAEGIARTMSLYLSGSSLGAVEGYYPWPNTSPEAARLSLYFQRFGASESGDVQVLVRWTLKKSNGDSKTGEFAPDAITWQVGQPATLVAAYNSALKALAIHIEQSLNP